MGFSQGFYQMPRSFLINSQYLYIYLFRLYKKRLKRVRGKTKMIFKKTKKIKIKYINALKLE